MSYDDGARRNPHQRHIPIWSEDRKPAEYEGEHFNCRHDPRAHYLGPLDVVVCEPTDVGKKAAPAAAETPQEQEQQ
jgi:hypothetical protein